MYVTVGNNYVCCYLSVCRHKSVVYIAMLEALARLGSVAAVKCVPHVAFIDQPHDCPTSQPTDLSSRAEVPQLGEFASSLERVVHSREFCWIVSGEESQTGLVTSSVRWSYGVSKSSSAASPQVCFHPPNTRDVVCTLPRVLALLAAGFGWSPEGELQHWSTGAGGLDRERAGCELLRPQRSSEDGPQAGPQSGQACLDQSVLRCCRGNATRKRQRFAELHPCSCLGGGEGCHGPPSLSLSTGFGRSQQYIRGENRS